MTYIGYQRRKFLWRALVNYSKVNFKHFFNQYDDEIAAEEVVKEIDSNTAKLKKIEHIIFLTDYKLTNDDLRYTRDTLKTHRDTL